jgi:hypothetical protein
MRAERPARHNHPAPASAPAPTRPARSRAPARDLTRLQRQVGNQAVTALVVQRMEDPGGAMFDTLRALHVSVSGKYTTLGLPNPSRVRTELKRLVAAAADKNELYNLYAKYVVKTYYFGSASHGEAMREEIVALAKGVEVDTTDTRKKRDRDLEVLNKNLEDRPRPPKKARTESGEATTSAPVTYSLAQQGELIRRLDLPEIQVKLFAASNEGYQRHLASARPEVAEAARLNALDKVQPLSTADMASAHARYVQSTVGEDSLLLERGKDNSYHVTMGRRGGQDIHQLGPYLPGGLKPSVEQTIERILRETKLTSSELAQAIDIQEPEDLEKFLEGKDATNWHLGKIRAMRHLRGVEMHRGPEAAAGTALEHRSAVHRYSHIANYPRLTPLGPPDATTNLRLARQLHLATRRGGEPETYGYIPQDTRERALGSKTRFLKAFVKNPRPDKAAEELVAAVLEEDETAGPPSQRLIEAMKGVM